jgi:hypothetical protein
MKTRFLYDPDVTQRLLESSNSSSSRDTTGIADVLSAYLSRTATDRGIDTLRIWKHTTHGGNAVKTVTEFDTNSNFLFPWVAVDVTDLCPVSNRDLPVVREKVDRALRCLEIGCSVPRSFFGAFTFRFAVRSEPQRPRSISSCSFGKYPGLTLLINVQQDRIDSPMLIDAVVHEAIHAAIYVIESLGEPLVSEPFPPEVKVQSPWSGNALYIDQFAQACFVWWGLANLWRRFFSDDETISKRANELLAVASAGFAHDPIKCLLTGEAKNWITKEGQAALWKIREMTAIT